MGKKHKKLSVKEREKIFCLANKNESIREMGRILGRSPSSISEELRRNGMTRSTYSLTEAQVDCNIKNSLKGRRAKLQENDQLLKLIIIKILKEKWSPEQVAGYLKIKFKYDKTKQISHETIYQYIYSIPDSKEKEKYIKALRRKRKKRRSRKDAKPQRGPISNPISIHERPLDVELREIPGHWEGDSIVGKNNATAIGTLVERTSRYTLIVEYGNDKSAENVARAFAKAYKSIPKHLKKSLTFDRGSEMAQHELFTELTEMPVYFADPGCPGQRGTNENTNGLIRQFFPKKTDFSKISKKELQNVENLLNQRPRKILGFSTPLQMLEKWRKRGPEQPLNQASILKRSEKRR